MSSTLTERLAHLTPEQRAVLVARLGDRRSTSAPAAPINHPASPVQRRLWFLDRLYPESLAYLVPAVVRLVGALDVDALKRAARYLVDRHGALRTAFEVIDGEPVQRVLPHADIELLLEDLRTLPAERRQAELNRAVDATIQEPMSLSQAPLLRLRLFRTDDQEHILVIVVHHIVSDGWSVGILFTEFASLYESFSQGRTPSLDPLPCSYTDIVEKELDVQHRAVAAEDLEYWVAHLRGVPTVIELPTDHERPRVQRFRGRSEEFLVPEELTRQVAEFGRQHRATPFMVLLAAYQVLLYRMTGQEDFVVGIPVANRDDEASASIIGFFANTLPVRADLSGQPSFSDVLARVRDTCLNAYAHPRVPFDELVEVLAPERDLSRSPLLQASFAYQRQPLPTLNAGGVEFSRMPLTSHAARYDIELQLVSERNCTTGMVECDSDLFEPATMARTASRYVQLLRSAVAEPNLPVDSLELCNDQELADLVAAGTGPRKDWSDCFLVHKRVARVASAHPDRIAASCGAEQVSYAELVARVELLATRLRRVGVGRHSHVGVCLSRGIDMVVAMLAVHRAGGAYIPLDPDFPENRLAYMVDDAGAVAIITSQADIGQVPHSEARVIVVDEPAEESVEDEMVPSWPEVEPTDVAYLIYTSGSTGRPKGVQVPFRALNNLLLSLAERPGYGPEDVFLALTSLSFDISGLELFGPLIVGARLVIAEPDVPGNPALLAEVIESSGATLVQATPSTWRMLLSSGWSGGGDHLTLLCGGEPLPPTLAAELLPRCGHLWNMYGPTETTIWSSVEEITEAPIRLGQPIANTDIHVLDRHGKLAPFGVAGELCIGGDGLSVGYWGRPGLTAERFVAADSSLHTSELVYRTGDAGRRHVDGSIEFLGRTDHQVKIRGYRIEPGEVEAVVCQTPGVRAAVVGCHEHNGETSLVAWVESRGSEVTAAQVREQARRELPVYMTPAIVMVVEEFPMTPNGKVDRSRLPNPHQERDTTIAYQAPVDVTEQFVADAFAGLLQLDRVGVDDDFFQLGGHSLLATRLVSQLNQSVVSPIPLREVFTRPTVAGIAEWIRSHGGLAAGVRPTRRIGRRPDGAAVPLTRSQTRIWFLDGVSSGEEYVLNAALDVRGRLDHDCFVRAVERLAERHDLLRAAVGMVEGRPYLVLDDAHRPRVDFLDLTAEPAASHEELVEKAAAQLAADPFDLAGGGLLRFVHVLTGPEQGVVLLSMQHLISDQWSLTIILSDLLELVRSELDDDPASLPELEISFCDYAHWEAQEEQRAAVEADVAHLAGMLEGAPTELSLPMARPRPTEPDSRGAAVEIEFSSERTERLEVLGRDRGATPFMVLAAAVAGVLSRFGGGDDIVLGVPVAHRRSVELEPLVGLFVNTLPLRIDLSGEPSFEELVERSRSVALKVFEHQEASFERLVEVVNPPRDLARHPIFQVGLSMQDLPFEAWNRGGLHVETRPARVTSAKFDLEWIFHEQDGMIHGRLDYSTSLFDEASARSLVDALGTVLDQACANPKIPLEDLLLVDEQQEHEVLALSTGPETQWDAPATVPECISRMAAACPERVAVRFQDQEISYLQLEQMSNHLAHELRRLGVDRDQPVAVLQERSLELPVSLLAVMKAGGAYVPLDPEYPRERLQDMVEDCGSHVLLAHEPTLAAAGGLGVEVVRVDQLLGKPAVGAEFEALNYAPSPEDLDYIIYTSGSTGRPKGVMSTHAGLRNRLLWMQDTFPLDETDAVLQKTPYTFDVSVWEFFWPLMVGARLVMALPGGHRDPRYLARTIAEEGITTIHFVPSMLQTLLREDELGGCCGLRRVVCSGEALPKDLAERFFERLDVELHNLYGPTEAAIDVTWWQCHPDDEGHVVPIGMPIANTTARVLDRLGRPLPFGVPGELHLGGVQLARGYLGRPELSAERFIVDPSDPDGSQRLYRTGDLASLRADGALLFHGRLDHQVKLRGNRVELGEIEFALTQHPAVQESVVVVRGAQEAQRLVAYARGNDMPGSDELKTFLRQRLPEYMVPSAVVELEVFPLTRNGKLDRSALPDIDLSRNVLSQTFVAASTKTERCIAQIWSRLLGLEEVGVEYNFFDLGGHSLLMVAMRSELETAFQTQVSMVDLFSHPTVRSLSQYLDAGSARPEIRSDVRARAAVRRQAMARRRTAGSWRATPDSAQEQSEDQRSARSKL